MFDLDVLIYWLPALLISLSVHEFAHAYTAYYFGDPTPKMAGRVTLNPLAHIDPLGLLMIFLVRFGWGKPVPVNPHNLRNPRWHSLLVSLAGPLSNFVLALICGFLWHLAPAGTAWRVFDEVMIFLNLILMLFNLAPIPPLDGSKILLSLFPPRNPQDLINYLTYGPWLLLFIFLFGGDVILKIMIPAIETIANLIILQS